MITLNYTLNGFIYKQDFDTIKEAYSELGKINTDVKFVMVFEEDSNWNYRIFANGLVSYEATEKAQAIGCKSGHWGEVKRLIKVLKK